MQSPFFITTLALFFASSTEAQDGNNIPSLPQAVQNLPACSHSALAPAMNQLGCSTSDISAQTFNCLCAQHLGGIVADVTIATKSSCKGTFLTQEDGGGESNESFVSTRWSSPEFKILTSMDDDKISPTTTESCAEPGSRSPLTGM